ncbi:MAG TPA: RNA polymerase factor sigma-54 [Bacteroidales bacterium]|nr:RNA polymerase factor sigma-54 [Bacteroidales bacterium]HSA42123.1 RNA polymerase factor sigma-54 [Bacteroidales bacterium]
MLNQRLQQKLLQKLSPQQILLMKLLQIPSVSLEQRIKQEIEENPALEDLADPTEAAYESETGQKEENQEENEEVSKDDEFDLEDYLDEDEIPAYKLYASNTGPDDDRPSLPFASADTFQDSLLHQLGMYKLSPNQEIIAATIIGNLDDAGYLQRDISAMVDDLAFSQNIQASEEEILEVLHFIQQLDPPGIGARNLQECLLLQLRRMEEKKPALGLAIEIIEHHFNEFTRKHYDKILKKSRASEEALKAAMGIILRLNPKPGSSINETERSNQYIEPDFIITPRDTQLELTLNSRNTPELRVNKKYMHMLEDYASGRGNNHQQKEAVQFIRQKIDSARWFIEAIKQRQNTLYITMNAIMEYQKEYFLSGDETRLRPMILKDIAEIVNMDISTVSRVANSKYVQTPYGTFLLKTFFSESLQTESGEEVSSREIKKILSDCIESESKDKPLTDEELTDVLKGKGYNIARRTVAKYREQLNIPVARLRKAI